MNTDNLVAEIDAEISRLQQAKALLAGANTPIKRKVGRPANVASSSKATSFNPAEFEGKPGKRRTMSPEGRARVAEAQKLRWAKLKRAQKKAARQAAPASPKKTSAKTGPRKTANKKGTAAKKAPQTITENAPAITS